MVQKTQRNLRTGIAYNHGSTLNLLSGNAGHSPSIQVEKSRNSGAAAAVFARNSSYSNISSPGRE